MTLAQCPLCGGAVQHEVATEDVSWGKHTDYGEQILTVTTEFSRCLQCDETFLTYDQSMDRTYQMNEQIKERLGIDWLEENRKRRPKRKP